MPISLPSNLIISNVKLSHNTPSYISQAINLQQSSKDRGIHRLEGSFDITISNDVDKRSLEAFLLRIRGRTNPFYISLGGRFYSNTVSSSVISTSGQTAGDINLTVNALTGSITLGDMFTIANDDKTYMALDDLASAGGAFEVFPPIQKTFITNTIMNFVNPNILIRLTTDIQSLTYSESGLIHKLTFNWTEALQ